MPSPSCHVYGFSGSPFVWRVLLALEEKGIAHERTWVPRASGAHKGAELVAKNPRARALVRAHEADNYAIPATMPALEAGLMRPPGTVLSDADRERHRVLHAELARWDGYLAGGAPFLAGEAFSLADVSLFPLVAFCVRCGLRLAPELPSLAAWYARLEPRPAVQASWPPHWRESSGRDLGLNER